MIDWSKGYSARYYANIVDPATWVDMQKIEIKDSGGSINRSLTDLRQSASLDCEKYDLGIERWIRVWMDVEQSGESAHIPLFTGLATSPSRKIEGRTEDNSLQCYSVLKPAYDVHLLRGWYAAKGASGAATIKELLADCPAPLDIAENSPVLENYIVAEDGESKLSMSDRILSAIGWDYQITGDGTIHIGPINNDVVSVFDSEEYDILETSLTIDGDSFEIPNVFQAINDDITAIARDDDPESPYSTVSRGREVWMTETSCDISDGVTIEQYALYRLKQEQSKAISVSYDRRFVPDVYPGNRIRMSYPEQDIEGVFLVDSQTIELGYSARTSEVICR